MSKFHITVSVNGKNLTNEEAKNLTLSNPAYLKYINGIRDEINSKILTEKTDEKTA